MRPAADVAQLYTERGRSYVRFVRFVRYPQGLRAYFTASPLLRSGLRILDAGCGSGIVSLALRQALLARGFTPGPWHGFDLTPAMLDQFRATLHRQGIEGTELAQANVLQLDALPASWKNYDLIASASMLEYVARDSLVSALAGLRTRLDENGSLLLFITRDNWLMRLLIGRWWQSNLYTARQLRDAFAQAGFSTITFRRFPLSASYLTLWGFIIEAHR